MKRFREKKNVERMCDLWCTRSVDRFHLHVRRKISPLNPHPRNTIASDVVQFRFFFVYQNYVESMRIWNGTSVLAYSPRSFKFNKSYILSSVRVLHTAIQTATNTTKAKEKTEEENITTHKKKCNVCHVDREPAHCTSSSRYSFQRTRNEGARRM